MIEFSYTVKGDRLDFSPIHGLVILGRSARASTGLIQHNHRSCHSKNYSLVARLVRIFGLVSLRDGLKKRLHYARLHSAPFLVAGTRFRLLYLLHPRSPNQTRRDRRSCQMRIFEPASGALSLLPRVPPSSTWFRSLCSGDKTNSHTEREDLDCCQQWNTNDIGGYFIR